MTFCLCGPVENHINHLRRIILLHSYLYYHLHTSIVSDAKFDQWCKDLVYAHEVFPEYVCKGYEWEQFMDFNGNTGMHLVPDEWVIRRAKYYAET